ncbi:RHS repeat-associated core domain-containing protein [Pseudomonas mosselii]|uniref:RHS repeat-associated core domain-containing protein n=2 Tax=Pseudomonas mosselii TaxID=78327 RepID=A0ABX9B2C6_9PSED|nr:RHS repeat-associated core domain-containing protein [Pseudomonas mosselii]
MSQRSRIGSQAWTSNSASCRGNPIPLKIRNSSWLSIERPMGNLLASKALLATDMQGSVLLRHARGNHNATPYCTYGYTPLNPQQLLLGFNSVRIEPAGIYLLGNGYRAFHPSLMRFGSPDTASPFNAGGINAYPYCQSDPVNRTDPDGHMMRRIRTLLGGRDTSAVPIANTAVTSPSIPEFGTQNDFNSAQPAGLPHYFGGRESPPAYSTTAPDPQGLPSPTFHSPLYSPTPKKGEVILEFRNGQLIEVESLVVSINTRQTLSNSGATSGFARLRATNTQRDWIRNNRPLQTDNGILEAVSNGQILSRMRTDVQETQ